METSDWDVAAEVRGLPKEMAPQASPGTWETALALLPESGTVLVGGAGRGGLSLILGRRGYRITSVDLHPEHFQVPGMTCQYADFEAPLAFDTGSFDAVLVIEVVEHLESPWGFLREAIRVLKPGGSLVFTSPNVVTLPARLRFLRTGGLPYFRMESFLGCYHVTPIFPWAVERWAMTVNASIDKLTWTRANWPTWQDIPRHWERRWSRYLKKLLPVGKIFGEIACYRIVKTDTPASVVRGQHYA
jgi:SAM-dependent methyltransferase